MSERVLKESPESISAIARRMIIGDKSFYEMVSRHPSMKQFYVKSVELSRE